MLRSIQSGIREVARAREWWEFKLAPVFALFYASALAYDIPVISLWRSALALLLALVPGAIYVSVINDLTDLEDDLLAGKRNRMLGRSPLAVFLLLTLTITPGLVFAWLWRFDTFLLSAYLAAWLAYSLYSLPPFRFKTRGLAGAVCDAAGAHLFPSLVAVLLVVREMGRPTPWLWIATIAAWSFSFGLRGILWHQLTDRENDIAANVRTFATRYDRDVIIRLGSFVVFPIELVALTLMLWQIGSAIVALLLIASLLDIARRWWRWRKRPVIVAPHADSFIVFHDFYAFLFPLGVLASSTLRNPVDAAAIAVHLLLFPSTALEKLDELRRLRVFQKR